MLVVTFLRCCYSENLESALKCHMTFEHDGLEYGAILRDLGTTAADSG